MEFKHIKELIGILSKSNLKRVRFKDKNGVELDLEKKDSESVSGTSHIAPHFHPEFHKFPISSSPLVREQSSIDTTSYPEKKIDGKFIVAPLVGTIYYSPSPEDPPFVKVGDRVDESTVVCIIEAMKVMNEVKAGVSGTIAEILVQNGVPVEFGSRLFVVV